MEEEIIDGRDASLKVKNYFMELRGPFGVLDFSVEELTYDENKKIWKILCSFYPTVATQYKERYEVKVDARNGGILSVKKLEPKETT